MDIKIWIWNSNRIWKDEIALEHWDHWKAFGLKVSLHGYGKMQQSQSISIIGKLQGCNSLTECSKGELFHGFYFFLSLSCLFLSLSCLWSCHEIAQPSAARERYFMVSISFCLCLVSGPVRIWKVVRIWKGVRVWKGIRSCHEIA